MGSDPNCPQTRIAQSNMGSDPNCPTVHDEDGMPTGATLPGIARQGTRYGFAIMRGKGGTTFAHELGHNCGLYHSYIPYGVMNSRESPLNKNSARSEAIAFE